MFRFDPCTFLEEEHNIPKRELSYLMEVETLVGDRTGEGEVGRATACMAEASGEQQLDEGGRLLSISCANRILLWLRRVGQKLIQILLKAQA